MGDSTPLEPDVVERMALKPCPFCGGEPTEPVRQPEGHWKIFCHGCGIHKRGPKEAYAVAAWNARAAISAQSPQLEDVALAIAEKIHGPGFDPHTSPEAFDFACELARAALNSGIGGGS